MNNEGLIQMCEKVSFVSMLKSNIWWRK